MTEVTVPAAPPLVTVPNVELMHVGTWDISTGTATFTSGDLANAVAALDCPAVRRPVLKLGHTEPDPDEHGMRWDGEPAIGYIANMAVVEGGRTLVGDYAGMPAWLTGEVLASAYPDRSIEGHYDFRCQLGHTHPFVVTAVALLGVVPPGIGTLQSLQDVAALYGVAAADAVAAASGEPPGTPITVAVHAAREDAVPNPRPAEVRAGVTTDDVRRAFYDSEYGKSWDIWITELQLDPELQLIVVDDASGKLQRVPVVVGTGDGEDAVTFGDPVPVVVRYEDAPATANAAAAVRPALRYASRQESRPAPVNAAAKVSDAPWSEFTQADYTVEQWHAACLIHTHDGDPTSKNQCKLPVYEPDGTLNRAAVEGSASSGIYALKNVTDEQRQAAAEELVRLYNDDLNEDPPERLVELAGTDDTADAAASRSRAQDSPREQTGSRTPARAPENSPAAAGAPSQEGAGMDPAKLREALGLQPEASDDEVRDALTTQGVITPTAPNPAGTEEEAETEPAAHPAAPEGGADTPEGEQPGTGTGTAAASLPPGTVAIDEATLAELRAQAQQGVAARAEQLRQDRDRTLDAAIKAGKFPPARRAHWEAYWQRDEEGARAAIADLAEGLVPVEDAGEPGTEPDGGYDDIDRLFSVPVPKGA
ncbi:hypothetical protein [Actinomadura opuntiae]|uniref:hypothetical protein n=1 Tax=Actinomadura sp. OS1-43 TaxID=604315 RepID=UPI00255B37EA|nr:hypothetical protein [Actinomadura sp. OS1-43]MDL4812808.1 hypothetical protein [Actinomadura sp. OS1-43]